MKENIGGYTIRWKGYGENAREAIGVSIEEGLEMMKGWMQGESIFLLDGGAYAYSNVEAIEPIEIVGTDIDGKPIPTISSNQVKTGLKQLLEEKTLNLKQLTDDNFSQKRNQLPDNTSR